MYSIKEIISLSRTSDSRSDMPVIGITANTGGEDFLVRQKYAEQVHRAGGVAVVLPPVSDPVIMRRQLMSVDAIIFTGGADHNPLWMGEEPVEQLGSINSMRDHYELPICLMAYNMNMPMFGICRGMQTMAIALGGHVCQHISTPLKHSQEAPKNEPTHTVNIAAGSMLAGIMDTETLPVNSFHHQAVDATGTRFRPVAYASDGIIEAMESAEHRAALAVQWHPEQMEDRGLPLFRWLAEEARVYKRARRLHRQFVTLDSHCDTPMLFSKGADFLTDNGIALYDINKMDDADITATAMVCYLPQPKDGKSFRECVDFDIDTPAEYADLIFDRITDICQKSDRVSIAKDTDELAAAHKQQQHAIMLGIENGLALCGDIRMLQHFYDRGVRYITLCHNGDNDICDSARGTQTHGGLSAFGHKVIEEMNRLGMLIDLSHAGEQTFFQTVAASKKPVVCTHSNCRALCNHPRNLTDEQMRTLAEAGGVMQLTLYAGFLRDDSQQASVCDFIRHMKHAVSIMGIDHVGIGSDFDGDGGVSGAADAAELLNITCHLIKAGFSDSDIEKIWGGNFMRIMHLHGM